MSLCSVLANYDCRHRGFAGSRVLRASMYNLPLLHTFPITLFFLLSVSHTTHVLARAYALVFPEPHSSLLHNHRILPLIPILTLPHTACTFTLSLPLATLTLTLPTRAISAGKICGSSATHLHR